MLDLDNLTEKEKKDHKTIGRKGITENLSFDQRRELMALIKRMIPPVPSRGLIDIRFAFWFIRSWYVVFIFGRDKRKQFKALDKGDMDRSLTAVARVFTYSVMLLVVAILIVLLLYMLKSMAGIDLYPDSHFIEVIKEEWLRQSK
jgi:hypothetical protein